MPPSLAVGGRVGESASVAAASVIAAALAACVAA